LRPHRCRRRFLRSFAMCRLESGTRISILQRIGTRHPQPSARRGCPRNRFRRTARPAARFLPRPIQRRHRPVKELFLCRALAGVSSPLNRRLLEGELFFAGLGLFGEGIELEVGVGIRGIDVDLGFKGWLESTSILGGVVVTTGFDC